ncbi:Queuine tRNA-ribosyltransferase [Limihaloglobus sulfuriphilus]|uniref:Queuine tRNA-ribosyltransferase n=1 Tax=Limihaloglobus sulfuriphilus TaxID=1851148 RepID=A0A1Q2MHI5_9BACT|nr:tRNA guanosine(34) transglycosylase Tgt [Limihaloglobus sulfuriphilus]AQQ72150.1 Queuine tRNA-ribosyltransferase [Limihaloglobus sulfuriphilus]
MSIGKFEILCKDAKSNARKGLLTTGHGDIRTPVFMPVGTRGSVKGLTPEMVKDIGSQIILANTYHMYLRPGIDVVEQLGGLHKLMAWDAPILTDSGGYQVFSLSTLNRIGDDGVEFASHIDGQRIYLDPAIATDAQNRLGADIIMAFDECAPYPCERERLVSATERSIRWAKICKDSHKNDLQLLFAIVQGGIDLELRSYCADKLVEIGFPGYAMGGLSVGEGFDNMIRTTAHTVRHLPEDKPRYLMGVGMPADLIAGVREGIDMFDCVLPTRNGRNASAFTEEGPIKLRNSVYTTDIRPLEEGCGCYCCRNFSRGTLRHFFNVGEMLGPTLVSIHNITFLQRIMDKIHKNIDNNTFSEWSEEKLKKYAACGYVR